MITITALLTWATANWGTITAIGIPLVSWILPKKYKDKIGYKIGASISAFGRKILTKPVWETLEVWLERAGMGFLKAVITGLNSDDKK